jgi:hypothetical protein
MSMRIKSLWVIFFVVVGFLENVFVQGDQTVNLRKVANKPQWHRMLHLKQAFPWISPVGEVDGEGFYLSQTPKGRLDPFAELNATIDAFVSNTLVGKKNQLARCAFPARLNFILENLDVDIPKPQAGDCPDYEDYLAKLNPQQVTIVFSSAYVSNPASMFGHTFLKIDDGRPSDLLNYSIGFAANVSKDENGLFYVLAGLLGGFRGQFSFYPYYERVNEYINAENRNLWEYTLDLNEKESLILANHLWELESNSWFDYYFLSKNCSYQLLTVLEVARPNWDLSSGWLFVIPAETIKKIRDIEGAIKSIRFRPSQRSKTLSSLALLTPLELETLAELMQGKVQAQDVESAAVLGASIQILEYKRVGHASENASRLALWDSVLVARSKFGNLEGVEHAAGSYQTPQMGHPENGHGPTQIGLGSGFALLGTGQESLFQEFRLKPAYHDLFNNDLGYPAFSEIDFPSLVFRYYDRQDLFALDTLQLAKIYSLIASNILEDPTSWKVDVAVKTLVDVPCAFCRVLHVEGGLGKTLSLFKEQSLFYALAVGFLEAGNALKGFLRGGPGVDLGVLFQVGTTYKIGLRSLTLFDLFQPYRPLAFATLNFTQAFSMHPNWDLRLEVQSIFHLGAARIAQIQAADGREIKMVFHYYF